MRDSSSLTPLQLEILGLVWDEGECTITHVWERLREKRHLARNTVLTVVQRLEQYGWLKRKRRGRSDVYRARVSRQATQAKRLKDVVQQVFEGSAENLLRSLLGSDLVGPEDLRRARKLLEEAEARGSEDT